MNESDAFSLLYDFEGIIEKAIATAFTSLNIAAYTSNDTRDFQTTRPRVELVLEVQGSDGLRLKPVFDGTERNYAFFGSIKIAVVTGADDKQKVTHNAFRSLVRGQMEKVVALVNKKELMPFHELKMPVANTGPTSPVYDPKDGSQRSVLTYPIKWTIKPSAWNLLESIPGTLVLSVDPDGTTLDLNGYKGSSTVYLYKNSGANGSWVVFDNAFPQPDGVVSFAVDVDSGFGFFCDTDNTLKQPGPNSSNVLTAP